MAAFYTKFIHETFDAAGQITQWSYDYGPNFNYAYDVIDALARQIPAEYELR